LNERFSQASLPKIELVDTKKQPANSAILTPVLLAEIKKTIENKKQVILFQNRRGYAPYFICETCGWIPHCKHCDVTLTYHKAKNMLSCHYCGTGYPIVNTCEACGKNSFKQKSFGTEQIEVKLMLSLPGVHVARMDYDNVKGKNEHDHLIQQFEQKQIDILVGTQMVTKGLDFEHVSLVGIINADQQLNFPDFRSYERAFQILTQVAGRAGRRAIRGKVLIQTSRVTHPVLELIKQNNFDELYFQQINERKEFLYPPFYRLIEFTFISADLNLLNEASSFFADHLKQEFNKHVLGPEFPLINKIRNEFYKKIILKIERNFSTIKVRESLIKHLSKVKTDNEFKKVKIKIDVDPI
jgi:primosomal protein N' (replication factor Y)